MKKVTASQLIIFCLMLCPALNWAQNNVDSLALVALYNATNGTNWTNTWDLNQPLDTSWYGVTLDEDGRVSELDLSDNQLSGNIPSELGDLSNLTHFKLVRNQLNGSIPIALGNLNNLTVLYLGSNQLSGNIPPELGNLSNLTYLNLTVNQLSGNIPVELGNLGNLIQLYLNVNQLNGNIPVEFEHLSNLTHLRLESNELSGNIPVELGNLSNLTYLHLESNQLSGSIPATFSNLTVLQYLTLQENQLNGIIPDFSNLQGLWLHENRFLHEDIAASYTANNSIPDFLYSPQYYGYEQHQSGVVGQQIMLHPKPAIPYTNPSVRWRKNDNFITPNFASHDTIYVIPTLDSMDIGVYEYWFIDSTLTPLVEFQSLPINNYIINLDLEGEPIIADELIVDLSNVPEDSISIVLATLASLGGEVIDSCGCNRPLYLYQFNEVDVYSILDTLGKVESSKESAGVDGGFNKRQNTLLNPNGESRYLPRFFEPAAYLDTVVVAYLDTGIDITHPGVQNHLWINPETDDLTNGYLGDIGGHGFDFVNKTGDVNDVHGHGTGVGGLIAENIPSEANIQVMPIKIYGDSIGTLFNLGCGIHYAVDNHADLINISVGYKGEKSVMLENALQRAKNDNVIVVTSAGNQALNIDEEKYWPAGFANANDFDLSNVLTVAALDSTGNFWSESNYGPETVSFAVRGENLVVPTLQNYSYLTGTSASAPLATLTLAINMAADKNRTYQNIIDELDTQLDTNTALDTLVKNGKWLDIELTDEVMNLDIKVLLEGATFTSTPYEVKMRTALYDFDLLPKNVANSQIEHPYYNQLGAFTGEEWNDTPVYSPDVVDWVLLSLREDLQDTTTTFYKTPAWLLKDGTIKLYAPIKAEDIDFDSLNQFYIIVEHRNHLPIATANPLNKAATVMYDFTQQNAYFTPTGVGQKEILPGVWAMYGGNVSTGNFGFEDISGNDVAAWSNLNGNFFIYDAADINLDGEVNGGDKVVLKPNNGVFSATPK